MKSVITKLLNAVQYRSREFRAYKRAIVRKSSSPNPKFVLLSGGRRGSLLLIDLINSHPNIYCDGEMFHLNYVKKLVFPTLYLKGLITRRLKDGYGFKLSLRHLELQQLNPKAYLTGLHNHG